MNFMATEGVELMKHLRYLEDTNVHFTVDITTSLQQNFTFRLGALELYRYIQDPSAYVSDYLTRLWRESGWDESKSASYLRGQCNARNTGHRRCQNVRAPQSMFCTVQQHADLGKSRGTDPLQQHEFFGAVKAARRAFDEGFEERAKANRQKEAAAACPTEFHQ